MNDFKTDNAYSHSKEDFWEKVYKHYFPTMVSNVAFPNDIERQNKGIDRELTLENGKIVYIEEKLRRTDYGDILLEYISNDRYQTIGWMEKDLAIDYFVYGVKAATTEKIYLLPWVPLKAAWEHYKIEWKAKYKKIIADNGDHNTISVAVSPDVIFEAINRASIIKR